jgi:hypothetical protein
LRRLLVVLVVALSASLAQSSARAGAAPDASSCGARAYSYAGIVDRKPAAGISATLQLEAIPRVEHGHVAAWVGVGGVGMGANGADEWLQAGLAAEPTTGSVLYYEVARPHAAPQYVEVMKKIAIGEKHRIAVIEVGGRPDWWRVWVDGTTVTRPILLPGSHGRWAPVATSESWNGGVGACNSFAYRFGAVQSRHLAWAPMANPHRLQSPGYQVRSLGTTGLVTTGGPARQPLQAQTTP